MLILIVTLFLVVNYYQPLAYMDEVFHIKQAASFAHLDFSYDKKLTTPPLLYLLSLPLSFISSSPLVIRFTNILFLFATRSLFNKQIALFPLFFFFCFLYYSDPSSTFLVLAALKYSHLHSLSATLLLLSVAIRQTNIIWCLFILVNRCIAILNYKHSSLLNISSFIKSILSNIPLLLKLLYPFLLVLLSFIIFIVKNNGIVLGDKQNHQSSLHLMQLYYFSSFLVFFMLPILDLKSHFIIYWKSLKSHLFLHILFSLITLYIINNYTISHPFLLSDNRHYTFYIFKRILNHRYLKYIMIPIYNFNIQRAVIYPTKTNPILAINANAPLAFAVSAQSFKPIPRRNAHVV